MTTTMNRRRFVEALSKVALDEVVLGELAALREPPGRRPRLDLVARSEWFASLDADAQSQVVDTMTATAYAVLHSILVIMDGDAALDDAGSAGRLRVLWRTDDDLLDLSDPVGGPDLHDLLTDIRG